MILATHEKEGGVTFSMRDILKRVHLLHDKEPQTEDPDDVVRDERKES